MEERRNVTISYYEVANLFAEQDKIVIKKSRFMGEKTKKQHYVPQCYLKAWEIDGRHKVYVYDKEKQESRINNIEDVASGRYFYDFSLRDIYPQDTIDKLLEEVDGINVDDKIQVIEKALSIGIERPYAHFLTEIIENAGKASKWCIKNCYFLRPDSKEAFAGLLAIQYVRTAHVRNMIRDLSDEISQFVKKMGASPQVLSNYRTLSKTEAKNVHIEMLTQDKLLSGIAFAFQRLKWVLGINRTSSRLLTSDNPICIVPHCNNGPMPMTGLLSKGVEAFITLSPDYILIMRDGDFHKQHVQLDMHYIEIKNNEIIDAYNAFISIFAERCIYSKDGDFSRLERIKTEDARLIQTSQTVLEVGDGFIHSKVNR